MKTAFIVLVLVSVCLPGSLRAASISSISFSDFPDQGLGIGQVGKFVAKFLGADGQNYQVGEKGIDLSLNSSCAMGEFSASSTNWQTVQSFGVNSNWASRTFYYRDSTVGRCDIIATVSGKGWAPARATIEIGTTSINVIDDNMSSSSEESISDSNDSGDSGSNYSGSSLAENKASGQSLSISLGKKQQTITAGVPLAIKAKLGVGKNLGAVETRWSFGDGGAVVGGQAVHSYNYPGDYIVIAKAISGEKEAEARMDISVIEPSLAIEGVVDSGLAVIVKNNSHSEINLAGTHLIAGDRDFVFPDNTIVKKDAKVAIPSNISGLVVGSRGTVKIISPTGRELASFLAGAG